MDKKVLFISESEGSELSVVSTAYKPQVRIVYNKLLKATKNLPDTIVDLSEFIDIKGMKAQGNQLTKLKVKEVVAEQIEEENSIWPDENQDNESEVLEDGNEVDSDDATMEWDLKKDNDDDNQPKLF